jgi:hypothetical protein
MGSTASDYLLLKSTQLPTPSPIQTLIWNDFTQEGMSQGQLILGYANGDLTIIDPLTLQIIKKEESLFE